MFDVRLEGRAASDFSGQWLQKDKQDLLMFNGGLLLTTCWPFYMKLLLLLLLLVFLVLVRFCWLPAKRRPVVGNSIAPDLEAFKQYPYALYPVRLNGKWGYMNRAGQLVIPCQFEHASDYYEGRAAVTRQIATPKNGTTEFRTQMGYIDTTGQPMQGVRYDEVADFAGGLGRVKKNGKYGFVDKTGRVAILPQFEEAGHFAEGLAAVKQGDKTGFINEEGEWILEVSMSRSLNVLSFKEGYTPVYQIVAGSGTHFEEDLGGYLDQQGQWLVTPRYLTVLPFSEGLAAVCRKNYKFAFLDTTGKIALETDFDDTHGFHQGIAIGYTLSADKNQRIWYGIDKRGNRVLPQLPYDFVGIFRNGLAGVEKNGQWGFIDRTGREVVKPRFTAPGLFRNGLARMEIGAFFSGTEVVYIDKDGKYVWKPG